MYTSNPKRQRTTTPQDAVPPPPAAVNGHSNHHTALAPAGESVRPQALYVNLNNQAFPVLGVGDRMPRPPTDLNSVQPNLMGPTSNNMGASNIMMAASMPGMTTYMSPLMTMPPNGQQRPPPPLTSMPQVSLPGYNLQPNMQHPPSSFMPTNSARSRPTPAPQPSTSSASNADSGTATLTNVPAYQIRIGSRKFIPVSTVQFKEDGVLFTLSE